MVVHLYNELNGITIFQFQISQHVFVKLVSPMHLILWAAGDGLFAFQVLRILNLIVYSIKSLLEKKKKCIFSLVVAKNLNYLMQFWIIFTAKQNYFFPISLFVKIFYDQKNIRSVKKKKKKIEYFSKLSVVKCFLQSTKQSNEESINNTWENVVNADEIPDFRLIIWIIMTFWQK